MKNAKIDEKMYKKCKTLLNGGATYEEVQEYTGVSSSSVWRISTSDTYDDYKRINAERYALKKKRTAEKATAKPVIEPEKPVTAEPVKPIVQSVTVQATHYMMQEMQETNRLLKEISNKLAFIVEQLA